MLEPDTTPVKIEEGTITAGERDAGEYRDQLIVEGISGLYQGARADLTVYACP